MKCPICNKQGNDEYYTPSGLGFEAPYEVLISQRCANNHTFGKKIEVSIDKWNYAMEIKLRKDSLNKLK